jgi:hypothetical protein
VKNKGLEQSATQRRIAKQLEIIPPSIGQFALSERDDLLATIAEQARKIERLASRLRTALLDNAELAAMKAKPGAVVMPERKPWRTLGQVTQLQAEGWNACLDEVVRLNSRVQEGWTLAADQVPQTGKAVLAHYTNSHGMGRRIRAECIAAWTVQAEDVSDPDTECVEYSKQDDAYYLTAGWYELVDNWDEYGRIAVNEGVITHWMPLPAAPAPTVEPARSDVVKVPRELLKLIDEAMCDFLGEDDPLIGDLRALLAGGEV